MANKKKNLNVIRASLVSLTLWFTLYCVGGVSTVAAFSLEEAVATAFNTNPDLKSTYHNYRAAQQDIVVSRAQRFPEIGFTASAGFGRQDVPESRVGTQDEDTEPTAYGFSLKQLLFNGFTTTNSIKKSKQEARSEFYQLLGSAENIALDIVRAYLNVLEHEQLKELAFKNLDSHRTIYKQIQLRTESGLGS